MIQNVQVYFFSIHKLENIFKKKKIIMERIEIDCCLRMSKRYLHVLQVRSRIHH